MVFSDLKYIVRIQNFIWDFKCLLISIQRLLYLSHMTKAFEVLVIKVIDWQIDTF